MFSFKKIAVLASATVLFAIAGLVELYAFGDSDYSQQIEYVDYYSFKMRLNIPRIYNNTESLGYRKYQAQTVTGEALFLYGHDGKLLDVQFTNMVNQTYTLSNGKKLTYPRTVLDTLIWPRFNAIGSNKTDKFNTASINFYLAAEPSYNIGEFDEDNALYIMLAGKGKFHSSKKYLKNASGYVAGSLGCGCMAYGHVSPTRKIEYYGPGDTVDDVAAVFGRWQLTYNRSKNIR